MQHSVLFKSFLITFFLFISIPTLANSSSGEDKSSKPALLLVTFGTSDQEAQKAFVNIERMAQKRFKDFPIFWAYTSEMIRAKLKKQGKQLDSPMMALARIRDQGYDNLVVQSLHVIAGAEYDDLVKAIHAFQSSPSAFSRIAIGKPLLANNEDVQRVAKLLLDIAPDKRKKNEALVFMGHGSEHHAADLAYGAIAFALTKLDPRAFLGTVEGAPTFEDVLHQCKKKKIKKTWLIPFMSVAGDHAKNDLAGNEDDSWKQRLEKESISTKPILKGIAEYDAITNLWLDHLDQALLTLNNGGKH